MNHYTYMQHALDIARLGWPAVSPNPMVGCVIVNGENKIVSTGFHEKFGGPHAEVKAITNLPSDFDFSDCTLYVNLEPCSHHGKTPPCTDLIIKNKFRKVVLANKDSNLLVSGKGIEKLKNAGIEVEAGVLEDAGRELNKRFFTYHEKQRPYVILKWAQTADGFISKLPPFNNAENWISGEDSKILVHRWRSEEQAIMVGTNTVLSDDPELTTRLVAGGSPIRIVIDRELKIGAQSKVFSKEASIIVHTERSKEDLENITYVKIDFSSQVVKQVLYSLYQKNILSIIVEGGAELLQSFINENAWDEARVFVNPEKKFNSGKKAPDISLGTHFQKSGTDLLYIVENKNSN